MKSFTALAHGRVNLIGEHTDYNLGFVLPTSIPQFTEVTITRQEDLIVRLESSLDPKRGTIRKFEYALGFEKKSEHWMDYLAGATHLLVKMGFPLSGMTVKVRSTVPEGSGLSSSAALEISFLKALREAFALPLKDSELALLGQRIENEFVGARVGIMDQMACALAKSGEALFLDTQSMTYESIHLPFDECDLLVINSGIVHRNIGGGYNERRSQCEEACKKLGIKSLREFNTSHLQKIQALPELLMKRARHVITENARVVNAVKAIKEKNLAYLGTLFQESHASMRDDYSVSLPEIDTLVDLLCKTPGVFGARLTGGGFGGSVVALTAKNKSKSIAAEILPRYASQTSEHATVLVSGDAS